MERSVTNHIIVCKHIHIWIVVKHIIIHFVRIMFDGQSKDGLAFIVPLTQHVVHFFRDFICHLIQFDANGPECRHVIVYSSLMVIQILVGVDEAWEVCSSFFHPSNKFSFVVRLASQRNSLRWV